MPTKAKIKSIKVNLSTTSSDNFDEDINYDYSKTVYFPDGTYIEEKYNKDNRILHRHTLLDPSGNNWLDQSFNNDGSSLYSEEVKTLTHGNGKIKEIITTCDDSKVDIEIDNYDSNNNLLKQTHIYCSGDINSITHLYDELGRQKEIIIKDNDNIVTKSIFTYKLVNLIKEEEVFDNANNLRQKIIYYHDFDGNIIRSEEFHDNNQIYCSTEKKYMNGQLVEELIFDNNNELIYQTINTYDEILDLIKEKLFSYIEKGQVKKSSTFRYFYELE
ncbi:MAG: hypothetical protein WAR79_14175 [Melioribacteraceae bacterium]